MKIMLSFDLEIDGELNAEETPGWMADSLANRILDNFGGWTDDDDRWYAQIRSVAVESAE